MTPGSFEAIYSWNSDQMIQRAKISFVAKGPACRAPVSDYANIS